MRAHVLVLLLSLGATSCQPKVTTIEPATPADAGAPDPVSAVGDAGPEMSLVPRPLRQYLACGCGCCPDVDEKKRKIQRCVYKAKGETLEAVRDRDEAERQDPKCANTPCGQGLLYGYCG